MTPPDTRRIWVTRSQPQADATAERLATMGFSPVVQPVLEARALTDAAIDLTGVDALAFTSGHAVDAYCRLSAARGLPVFAVGDATAAGARAAGFANVRSAGGDARALADLIAGAEPRPACVLNPTAAEPAADLVALLAERGVAARAVAVYETAPRTAQPPPERIDAVLVHSAKAARAAAASLSDAPGRARLDAYAISEAAAAPLRSLGLRSIAVAARPDEASLLALLVESADAPAEAPAPGIRLGPAFWVMIAFGVLMAVAGGIIGLAGPKLFPRPPSTNAAPHALGKPPPPR